MGDKKRDSLEEFKEFFERYYTSIRIGGRLSSFGLEDSFKRLTEGLSIIVGEELFKEYKNKLKDKIFITNKEGFNHFDLKGNLKSDNSNIIKEIFMKFHYEKSLIIYDRKLNSYFNKNNILGNLSNSTIDKALISYEQYSKKIDFLGEKGKEYVSISKNKRLIKLSYSARGIDSIEDDNISFEFLNNAFNKHTNKFHNLLIHLKDLTTNNKEKIKMKQLEDFLKN